MLAILSILILDSNLTEVGTITIVIYYRCLLKKMAVMEYVVHNSTCDE